MQSNLTAWLQKLPKAAECPAFFPLTSRAVRQDSWLSHLEEREIAPFLVSETSPWKTPKQAYSTGASFLNSTHCHHCCAGFFQARGHPQGGREAYRLSLSLSVVTRRLGLGAGA